MYYPFDVVSPFFLVIPVNELGWLGGMGMNPVFSLTTIFTSNFYSNYQIVHVFINTRH